jgi:hypothetical protein
LSFRVWINFNW